MNKEIENIKKSRIFLLNIVGDLSIEQLNEVPAGFNNNIIWNLGHLVAAQQGICYLRSGAPIVVDEKYWLNYKPGSRPSQPVDAIEVQTIKDMMLSTLDRLTTDYGTNAFDNYVSWTTRFGAELGTIDDAISFLPYHEGLHSGAILAMIKLVKR